MSIGSKIKSLRKKRGMTQDELASGIITRGMLSRIESETAMPSMQSLSAIAARLDVSPSFLLEDGNDILPAELARIAKAIEDEYNSENYQNCLKIFEIWNLENDNKFVPIFTSCAFKAALEAFYIGDFSKSNMLLNKIEDSPLNGTIKSPLIRGDRVSFLRTVMENIDLIDTAISLSAETLDFDFQPSLFLSLLNLMKNGKHEDCCVLLKYCYIEEIYKNFINAQMLIKDYKFIDAILAMKALYANEKSPIFLKLLCLNSMENCCKLCEDYKGAYENHIAYQQLLNSIKR